MLFLLMPVLHSLFLQIQIIHLLLQIGDIDVQRMGSDEPNTTADTGKQADAAHRRDTDDQRSNGWTVKVLHPVASLKKAAERIVPSEDAKRSFKERREYNREKAKESFRGLRRTLSPRR